MNPKLLLFCIFYFACLTHGSQMQPKLERITNKAFDDFIEKSAAAFKQVGELKEWQQLLIEELQALQGIRWYIVLDEFSANFYQHMRDELESIVANWKPRDHTGALPGK